MYPIIFSLFLPKTLNLSRQFFSTVDVSVLWDLCSKPPPTISVHSAAIRLRLAASSFGHVTSFSAYSSPLISFDMSTSLTKTQTQTRLKRTHVCRMCNRNFSENSKLINHFQQIHRPEHIKRINRINSAVGKKRVNLSAHLSAKINKFENVAKEIMILDKGCGYNYQLEKAGVLVRKVESLREDVTCEMERGRVGCFLLVSEDDGLMDLVREMKRQGLMSVVIGNSNVGLKRVADFGFCWKDVVSGKARCQGGSAIGKWKDRQLLKDLEWKFNDHDVLNEFEGDDTDNGGEFANKSNEPWWKLDEKCDSLNRNQISFNDAGTLGTTDHLFCHIHGNGNIEWLRSMTQLSIRTHKAPTLLNTPGPVRKTKGGS